MYKQGKNTSTESHSKWGHGTSHFRHLLATTEHTTAIWSIHASVYETLQNVLQGKHTINQTWYQVWNYQNKRTHGCGNVHLNKHCVGKKMLQNSKCLLVRIWRKCVLADPKCFRKRVQYSHSLHVTKQRTQHGYCDVDIQMFENVWEISSSHPVRDLKKVFFSHTVTMNIRQDVRIF